MNTSFKTPKGTELPILNLRGSQRKVNCSFCNKELTRFPSHIKGKKYGVFCDKDCLGKYRTKYLTGNLGANFKNGTRKDRGYIRVSAPWHPYKDKNGYVSLHRLISEAYVKMFLDPDTYVVHHIDGDPSNNHWDNLEITTQAIHAKNHIIGRRKNGTFKGKRDNK